MYTKVTNTILLTVLFVFLFSTARSQGLQFGIKAGANITKVKGESFKDEFNYGYNIGLFGIVKLNQKWGIQPELLFNQYDAKIADDPADVYNPSNFKDVKLNYLSIPILLNYNLVKPLTLQAGLQGGILMDKSKKLTENIEDAFTNGDISLLLGAQINIASFKISGRFYTGLNDINNTDKPEDWRNTGFQVSIGWRFL